MENTRILLGVTGSIASFKAVELASQLTQQGFEIDVIMTEGALNFVRPLSFGAITKRPVYTNLWDEDPGAGTTHIELADQADLVLLAPVTAHLLAQMAQGLAPDLLTSILLAAKSKVIACPAMNGKMWEHPATVANVEILKSRGVIIFEPEAGMLACGYEGSGRLPSVDDIVSLVKKELAGS
ncbi:MAG: flavoprotein [Verrucomicrobiota bacterium]